MKLHQHLFGNGKPLRCNAWAKPRRCAYIYIYIFIIIIIIIIIIIYTMDNISICMYIYIYGYIVDRIISIYCSSYNDPMLWRMRSSYFPTRLGRSLWPIKGWLRRNVGLRELQIIQNDGRNGYWRYWMIFMFFPSESDLILLMLIYVPFESDLILLIMM